MNKTIRRLTALLCAGAMMTGAGVTAWAESAAEADESSIVLPSGMTLDVFRRELGDMAQEQWNDEDPDFASAEVAVFQGDKVLFTEYYGETDISAHIPADETSVYEWGSISKTLVWVSAMQLWEEGKLDLERDVREYLPEGFFRHLTYDDPITMLNLMEHDAGWQETTRSIWVEDGDEILSLKDALQSVEPTQVHRPGEIVAYSNYGAAVAGYVVECVSGQDYCDYVHEHILEPLGMEHTALLADHSDNQWVYEKRREMKCYNIVLGHCIDLGNMLKYVPAYPAGAATGTLADLVTYAQALNDDSAPLFSSPETQELMFTATDVMGQSDIPLNAHGFWSQEYGVRILGHSGATLFGQADMEFDPVTRTGIVVMVNQPNGNDFLGAVPSLVFGELDGDRFSGGTEASEKLSGRWTMARSIYEGPFRYFPLMTTMSLDRSYAARDLGNGLLVMTSADGSAGLTLAGEKSYPGGRALETPSSDLVQVDWYLAKLCLFTGYFMMVVGAYYSFRIIHKLKKHGRYDPVPGSALIAAGHGARVCSVGALVWAFVDYMNLSGGLSAAESTVMGVIQMVCGGVCILSALSSGVLLVLRKAGSGSFRYVLNILGSCITVGAILYFQLYKFWVW